MSFPCAPRDYQIAHGKRRGGTTPLPKEKFNCKPKNIAEAPGQDAIPKITLNSHC